MSDLVKWGFLLGVLVACVALIINLPAYGVLDDIFADGGATEAVMNAFSVLSGYLLVARRVINNFVYPSALTAMICFSLFMWVIALVIRFATFIGRMIYK